MKISQVSIKDFKRFSDLTINEIPATTKVVVIVGPNGSGKSSLFDAFLSWYRSKIHGVPSDQDYYTKKGGKNTALSNAVDIKFHNFFFSNNIHALQGKFYFRTAYRNQADFTVNGISKQNDPTTTFRFGNLIQNDAVVEENYQRLVSLTLKGIYDEKNDHKSVLQLRDELIGKIRLSLQNIFDDLNLSSIGDPIRNGSFYFEKGISKDFHYKNLSGGEKSAFDLILDLIIKSEYYPDAIFCIDEPETHMHTKLQSKLFKEIYRLIPESSQLWINTHSLGILKKAREFDKLYPQTIAFIDFDNIDFDVPAIITPSKIDKTIWGKFVEITLDDLSNLLAPKNVIFCEGNQNGRKYKGFDAIIYNKIFNDKYPDTSFISIGSSTEIENEENITYKIISGVLRGSNIIKIVDRDAKSDGEIDELKNKNIKVLTRRHIESYLLDDELIILLCNSTGNEDKIGIAIEAKNEQIAKSIERGNPADDIKSASGDVYVQLKKLLNLEKCGNTKDAFFRDTICPLITEDTAVFKALEKEIF
jgi:AAA15 family ATPase/GTPase